MFPILYDETKIAYGQVPQDNGMGVLSDTLSCKITEERNGSYELILTYPSSGIHASELQQRRIIKVKPNHIDAHQLFRIYKISKKLKSSYTVYARHISYDLSGAYIASGTAQTAVEACALLSTNYFTLDTDKVVSASFNVYEPSSRRSWLGGKSGSLLDIFGTGEYHYDNYDIHFLLHRGQDHGVEIRYGKNLMSLSQDVDSTNLYTHVVSYWKNIDTDEVVTGTKIATGLNLDVENVLCVDVSNDFTDKPTVAQVDAKTQHMINNSNFMLAKNSIKLSFLQLKTLTSTIGLCDDVTVYYEDYRIQLKAKCIKTTWDAILERYDSIEVGDIRTTFVSTFVDTMNAVTDAQATASAKVSPTNIRTAWAVDDTSIYVQSGQIHFNAGTFLVTSSNLIIDQYGNVKSSSFKSNDSIQFCSPNDWNKLYLDIGYDGSTTFLNMYGFQNDTHIGLVSLHADENGVGGSLGLYNLAYTEFTSISPAYLSLGTGTGGSSSVFTKTIKADGTTGNIECVSLTQTSTRKIKKNIKDLTDVEAEKLLKLNPVTYDFKDEICGKDKAGFIAEDVEIILPEVVSKDKNGEAEGINYIELIPYLTKLLQNQQKEIDEMKEKIK